MYNNCVSNLTEDVITRKNTYIYLLYGALSNILGNIFDFKNLNDIDEIDLKRCLFYSHYVGFTKNNDRLTFLPLNPIGNQNYYNEFTTFKSAIPLNNNIEFTTYSNENIVGFNRSFYCLSDSAICNIYANRLAELLISIDNAIIASRIINIFFGSENEIKDNLTMYQLKNIGQPFTFKNDIGNSKKAEADRQEHPVIVKDYYDTFREILNEFMLISGLSALTTPNKKERLLVGEIENTDDIKSSILKDKFQNRKAFLDKINLNYGTDYKVEFNINNTFFENINNYNM